MDNQKIGELFKHFGDELVTQEKLTATCLTLGLPDMSIEDYGDHVYQKKCDDKTKVLVKKIFPLLNALEFIGDYDSEEEIKRIKDNNEEVRTAVLHAIEESAIDYRVIENIKRDVGQLFKGSVEGVVDVLFAKSTKVLMRLAYDKFGGDLNTKLSADFIEGLFKVEEDRLKKEEEAKLSTE